MLLECFFATKTNTSLPRRKARAQKNQQPKILGSRTKRSHTPPVATLRRRGPQIQNNAPQRNEDQYGFLILEIGVGIRVVSDAYKMRAFLCDTRTWGRGSAPLERGHRPCRISWDKKVVVSGLCHSRSFPGTLSDAAAGLLYLHQDTCSARLRLYSNSHIGECGPLPAGTVPSDGAPSMYSEYSTTLIGRRPRKRTNKTMKKREK